MKRYNRFATAFCAAALGLLSLTGCEGGDLYSVDAPDWISSVADSIAQAKAANQGGEEEIEGLEEDVYTVGVTDYSSGWWAVFSKYYQIPEGQKWVVQFNLNINPSASNTYKNFALLITNDEDRGAANYVEYGAIRYDYQPSGNSEWGDYIDRSLATSDLEFQTDTDAGVDKLGGKVTLTIDRTEGGLIVKMANGKVTKTYTQTSPLVNLNADASNTTIRAFLVPEGSYIDFIGSTIEPIGGYTSAEDKQPLSMTLTGVPSEVIVGTELSDAMVNVSALVEFEQGVTKTVTAEDLQFEAIPNMNEVGQKTLVVIYNKTFKGVNCDKPIIASKEFKVVSELSAFTQTVVVPNPLILGAEDNSSGWWSAHTDNIKVEPKETKVVNFTNYTTGANNWNNFVIVLNKASLAEYAVLRADNYGWGDGYAACTPVGGFGTDEEWETWRGAMDGAKVTAYITNNGDGTASVKSVMHGTNGVDYVQEFNGINTVDPDDMYFRFTVDGCHLVFDYEVGAPDCSTGWWGAHSPLVQVKANQVCTFNFTNYTSGVNNWNNFVVVLNKVDLGEYAVLRADNYGWGDGFAACTLSGGPADWGVWLSAMNGAKVTVQVSNNGDGTADVKAVMHGTNGVDYTQDYIGINTIDPDNFYVRFTVDSSYLKFE
jgi:hypothetical protein